MQKIHGPTRSSALRGAYELLDARTRRLLPALISSFAVVACLEAISIGLVLPLIMALVNPSAIQEAPGFAWLRSLAGSDNQRSLLIFLGAAIGVIFTVKSLVSILLTRWQYKVLARAEAAIGVLLFERYLRAPWRDVGGRNSSELIRNASTSLSHAFLLVITPAITLCVDVILSLAIVTMLMFVDWVAACVALGFALVAGFLYYTLVHGSLARIGVAFQEVSFNLLNQLKEGIGAGREIRVRGTANYAVDRMRIVRDQYGDIQWQRLLLNQLPRNYLETALVLGVLGTTAVAVSMRGPDSITPLLAVFAVAAFRLLTSASRILISMQQIRSGAAAVDAVTEDLRRLSTEDETRAQPAAGPEAGQKSGIVLSHVTFSYGEGRPALADISLRLAWGESLGIVGHSGSGKSTLVDIILGLLHPDSGRVEVDGRSIAEFLSAWRRRIGYVPQTIYLNDDTLKRNVSFGHPDAEIKDAAVARALEQASLSEFVASLPQGWDTKIGELGGALSGGQRQRIGIARALYGDPDVLILDEATSALDSETEASVLSSIRALLGSKTVILVSHRLSTLRGCDRLALLKNGRIVDVGEFEELTRRSAEFERMVEFGLGSPLSGAEL